MTTSKFVAAGARLRLTFATAVESEPATVVVGTVEEDARAGRFPFVGVDATSGRPFNGLVAFAGLTRVERA